MLNAGYYYSYQTEIAAVDNHEQQVMESGARALALLPPQEVLLRARISARMAEAAWRIDQYTDALLHYELAIRQDPSILRRLAIAIPVVINGDGSQFSNQVEKYLSRSPRFTENRNGLLLDVNSNPDLSICLKSRTGDIVSCYTMTAAENQDSKWNAQQLTRMFHTDTFGLGYDISKAQRSILLGSSVILSSQTNGNLQQQRDTVLVR